jgi:hypothetical protein
VGKPSILGVKFENMIELTVERNPLYVRNVGKPSAIPVPFTNTK